jgi:hypothetical protein
LTKAGVSASGSQPSLRNMLQTKISSPRTARTTNEQSSIERVAIGNNPSSSQNVLDYPNPLSSLESTTINLAWFAIINQSSVAAEFFPPENGGSSALVEHGIFGGL